MIPINIREKREGYELIIRHYTNVLHKAMFVLDVLDLSYSHNNVYTWRSTLHVQSAQPYERCKLWLKG